MSATIANQLRNAELLINAGADIEASLRDNTRYSVSGRVDIDDVLTRGSTAVFLAAQHGNLQLTELLISRGANVNVQTNHLFTPLHAAAIAGVPKIVQLLIDHGAGIDAATDQIFTPLIYAAHYGHDEVVLVLLKNGAKVEARKTHGMTALSEAFWKRRVQTIKLLLNHGASTEGEVPQLPTNALGYTERSKQTPLKLFVSFSIGSQISSFGAESLAWKNS